MRIIGVDPSLESTGLALVEDGQLRKSVTLPLRPAIAWLTAETNEPSLVVMEEPAWRGASRSSIIAFSVLWFGLEGLAGVGVVGVTPGLWKPVVRGWLRDVKPGLWEKWPDQHQRDAWGLAMYEWARRVNAGG